MKASSQTLSRSAIERLRRHPVVRKLKARYDFDPVATVEAGHLADFERACAWAIPNDDAAFRNLEGRVIPHLIHPEGDRALWDFEFEADARLFALKFGALRADLWT